MGAAIATASTLASRGAQSRSDPARGDYDGGGAGFVSQTSL